jgi:hypothetical protein
MLRIGLSMFAGSLMLAAMAQPPAAATTVFSRKFTCPIGGEAFEDSVIGSYSTFGQRPDGRSYGTLPVLPLVECPGNGFLLFEDAFTPEEIAKLSPLVQGPEYQAIRHSETPYYRAWWLMRGLGREPERLASALLVASWEADGDPARKVRYQRAFLEAAGQIVPESEEWFYYNLRAANALRELGEFSEAETLLTAVEASNGWPQDEDDREGARYLLEGLRLLAAEGNAHPEPTNLIPPMAAAERCMEETADRSPAERAACKKAEYEKAIADRLAYATSQEDREAGEPSLATAAGEADAFANMEAAADATVGVEE